MRYVVALFSTLLYTFGEFISTHCICVLLCINLAALCVCAFINRGSISTS